MKEHAEIALIDSLKEAFLADAFRLGEIPEVEPPPSVCVH